MNLRTTLPVVMLLGVWSPAGASPGDVPAEIQRQLRQRFGTRLHSVQAVASPVVRRHLPSHRAFAVRLHNPRAAIAGPSFLRHVILVGCQGKLRDAEPSSVVGLLHFRIVRSPNEIASVLAALFDFDVLGSPEQIGQLCKGVAGATSRERRIAPPKVVAAAGHGRLVLFALVDRQICAVDRFTVRWSSSGPLGLTRKGFSRRGGYR